MTRRDFFGIAKPDSGAIRAPMLPCSRFEPTCDRPRQFERALMLADLCKAGLISSSLAGRLADELQFEQLCWVPT